MCSVEILFTGDTSFTGVYRERVLLGEEIFSKKILSIFDAQDFVVCNFEGPATSKPNCIGKNTKVISPPSSVEYLCARNHNIFNLANNHMFDCGAEGFRDTRIRIKARKALYFGAGENIEEASSFLVIKKNNVSIALIGISHHEGLIADKTNPGVFCDQDFEILRKQIKKAREQANWVILNYHGGTEYTTIPMPRKRSLFHKLLQLDIDLIIGHHPHVFQGIEEVGGKTIFYSLGNFVFDLDVHRSKEFTCQSAIVKFRFNKNSYSYDLIPTIMSIREGKVDIGSTDFINHVNEISNFENYRKLWLKDAYRTAFQANVKQIGNAYNGDEKLFLLLEPKFYKTAWRTLRRIIRAVRSSNSRPVVLGAIKYIFLKRLGIIVD